MPLLPASGGVVFCSGTRTVSPVLKVTVMYAGTWLAESIWLMIQCHCVGSHSFSGSPFMTCTVFRVAALASPTRAESPIPSTSPNNTANVATTAIQARSLTGLYTFPIRSRPFDAQTGTVLRQGVFDAKDHASCLTVEEWLSACGFVVEPPGKAWRLQPTWQAPDGPWPSSMRTTIRPLHSARAKRATQSSSQPQRPRADRGLSFEQCGRE